MIELNCKTCGNKFKVYKYRANSAKYCSNKCRGIDFATKYMGENNPCYRGGKPKCKCGNEMWYQSKKCDTCSRKEDLRHLIHGRSKTKKYRAYHDHKAKLKRKGVKGFHTEEEWEDLKKTYKFMCLCCKLQEPEIKLSEDHIIPIVKGGTDYIWNIQPLCLQCNQIKHTKTIDYRYDVL